MCETGSNGVNKEESEEENRAERTNLKEDADETNPHMEDDFEERKT